MRARLPSVVVWQIRPDILIIKYSHLALTCVFSYLDNLSGYRICFNTRCKWGVTVHGSCSEDAIKQEVLRTKFLWNGSCDLKTPIVTAVKSYLQLKRACWESSLIRLHQICEKHQNQLGLCYFTYPRLATPKWRHPSLVVLETFLKRKIFFLWVKKIYVSSDLPLKTYNTQFFAHFRTADI